MSARHRRRITLLSMELQTLHVLHVFSALVLTGYTFFAFAGPAPTTRKKVLVITGIASLLRLDVSKSSLGPNPKHDLAGLAQLIRDFGR